MAGMPPSRKFRDPYRTPSPPPLRARRKIEDYGFRATKSVNSHLPRRSPENAMAAAEPRHTSTLLESEFSSPNSICSVPSLSMTPSSARSSELQIPTPSIQGGMQLMKELQSGSFDLESPDLFLFGNDGAASSEWDAASPTTLACKRSISTSRNAIALPNDSIQGQHISQPKFKLDHSNSSRHELGQYTRSPATPKHQVIRPYNSHTRTLAKAAKEDEKQRSQYTQQPLSMWTIAATVILLQRFMKGGSSRQGKSLSYGGKAALPRALLQESTSNVLISKNADVSSWLLQSEDSNSSSDIRSIDSLESDVTEDDSEEEEEEFQWGAKIGTPIIQWEQRVVPEDFMDLAQRALCRLPQETATKTLAAVRALFETWASHVSDGDASSSFNFSQAGGHSEHPTSNSRTQKRPLDEDDEQPPDNDDNNPRKRQNLHGTLDAGSRQMWACPYYQREPHRYCVKTELGDFRKCAKSPGFPELHRVKGHIYKCHSPKYCDRCYTVFKNDNELTDHRRRTPACAVKPPQQIDGLTSEQKELLKPRDRSNRSEEERWKVIYKICFPDDEVAPSPYYVHYSREVAELRREVLEIIRGEAQSPDTFDFGRLIERVQGAFNAQQSVHGFAPPEPGILTPSTSNTSNTSGGRSNRAVSRELCQRTPSLLRTSRQLASATGSGDALQLPNRDELDEPSDSAMTSDETSAFPSFMSHFSETDEILAFEQPNECTPVPFRGFTAPTPNFDFDEDQFGQEYSDYHDFDFPQQNLDGVLDL